MEEKNEENEVIEFNGLTDESLLPKGSDLLDLFNEEELDSLRKAIFKITSSNKMTEEEKAVILREPWRTDFKAPMPTPSEFLSEEWVGDNAKGCYPYLREAFEQFFDPSVTTKNYLLLYFFIGAGKTTLVIWIKAYMGVLFYLLKDPWKFFNKQETTVFVDMSISFSKMQCEDLIIKPLKQFLQTSPKFVKVRLREEFILKMKSGDPDHIYWMSGGDGQELLCIGHLHYLTACSPSQILGLNIISASMTEATFLMEQLGEEKTMRLFNDLDKRVWSRFDKNNRYAKVILDSSPNTMLGKMDQYFFKHKDDKNVVYKSGHKWVYQPWLFPEWLKDKENNMFWIFKGNSENPGKIISDFEVPTYEPEEIMKVPIDLKDAFEEDFDKTLKDWAGIPTAGASDALIKSYPMIVKCFTPVLRNEITWCYLNAGEDPTHMIWNMIRDKYFIKTSHGWKFYRNPECERFYSVDLAEKHDMASCSLLHLEVTKDGKRMYICDLNIVVLAKPGDEINLDAFKDFGVDLKTLGNLKIEHMSYDGFQSSPYIQQLKRLEIKAEEVSVDSTLEPYINFASYVKQGRLKIGKNIVIKNNMRSLTKGYTRNGKQITKLCVDHLQGSWFDLNNTDWETSMCGYYGKDGTDSLCQAIVLADTYGARELDTIWDEEKELKRNNKTIEDLLKENGWCFV